MSDLVNSLRGLGAMIRESHGISGFHLNGGIEPWNDFEAIPDEAADTIEALQAERDRLREASTEIVKMLWESMSRQEDVGPNGGYIYMKLRAALGETT